MNDFNHDFLIRLFHFRAKIPYKNNNPNGLERRLGLSVMQPARRRGARMTYADSGL